eukprot:SAG31_NODE_21561_length_546_cov_1.064877_1_plen_91_part_01
MKITKTNAAASAALLLVCAAKASISPVIAAAVDEVLGSLVPPPQRITKESGSQVTISSKWRIAVAAGHQNAAAVADLAHALKVRGLPSLQL